jgi:hypothetical protein
MKVLAIVGAVAVVVLGVAVYLFGSAAVSAGTAEGDSSRLLRTTAAHTRQIDDSLKGSDLTQVMDGANTDFKAAKQASDGLVTRLDQARTTVAGDRSGLATSEGRLAALAGNPWALPVRTGVRNQQVRVQSVMAALDAAEGGLVIERDQMRTVSALMDAMVDFTTLSADLQKQDIPGSLGVVPGLQTKLQAAVQLSQGPNNPPQIHDELTTLQTLVKDLQSLLQAEQRKDSRAAAALVPKLEADQKALEGVQTSGIDAYEQKLLQPYRDRYEAGFKAAGIQLV